MKGWSNACKAGQYRKAGRGSYPTERAIFHWLNGEFHQGNVALMHLRAHFNLCSLPFGGFELLRLPFAFKAQFSSLGRCFFIHPPTPPWLCIFQRCRGRIQKKRSPFRAPHPTLDRGAGLFHAGNPAHLNPARIGATAGTPPLLLSSPLGAQLPPPGSPPPHALRKRHQPPAPTRSAAGGCSASGSCAPCGSAGRGRRRRTASAMRQALAPPRSSALPLSTSAGEWGRWALSGRGGRRAAGQEDGASPVDSFQRAERARAPCVIGEGRLGAAWGGVPRPAGEIGVMVARPGAAERPGSASLPFPFLAPPLSTHIFPRDLLPIPCPKEGEISGLGAASLSLKGFPRRKEFPGCSGPLAK